MNPKTSDRFGTVLRQDGSLVLRYERRLRHPPRTVWSALTESASLRHWFPADIVGDRLAGAAIQLPFWPEDVQENMETLENAGADVSTMDLTEVLPGKILAFDPPRLFELVWGNPAGAADVLRFELEPDGGGTRLVFTTWLGEPGPLGHPGTAAGWHACLHALVRLSDTGTAEELDRQALSELRERYAALID